MKFTKRDAKALDKVLKKNHFEELAIAMGNRQMLTPYQRGFRATGKMKNIKKI